jgi:hypothetical protein
LRGILEDITIGPHSLLDAVHLDEHYFEKYLTLGEHPVRVAGMKVYKTSQDTCIFETPVMWGSKMVVSSFQASVVAGKAIMHMLVHGFDSLHVP